jgi:hypothetical protein
MSAAEKLFWELADELQKQDERIVESTIMNGRCLRVALVDFKGSGLVVKLPRARVEELIATGVGRPFAPAGRVFKEWLSVPEPNRRRWHATKATPSRSNARRIARPAAHPEFT